MRAPTPALLSLLAMSCGGATPTAPAPLPSDRVSLVVFLDENRNGSLDAMENVRIPGAEVTFAGITGRSAARTGELSLEVPRGSYPITVKESTLPPYYLPPQNLTAATTAGGSIPVPVTLPAPPSPLQASTYVAFGDSITNGNEDVGDGTGYREGLARLLRDAFGTARVENEGVSSSGTPAGARRIGDILTFFRPQFILILYGTNDWNEPQCRTDECFTVDNIQSMVRTAKARGVQVFLGTILQTSVGADERASPARNDWVERQNLGIAAVARSENVVLVDLHKAFETSPLTYRQLFIDALHPSAEGYSLMSRTWFDAITKR